MNKSQNTTVNGFSVDAPSQGTEATSPFYLLFAGAHAAPLGGLADLVGTFTSEEAARAAFRVVRLETASSRLGWAQLAVVDGQDGLKPLCWFGIGATPATARQAITAHPNQGGTMQTKTVEHQSFGHPDTRPPGLRRLSKKVTALLSSILATAAVPTNTGMMRQVRKGDGRAGGSADSGGNVCALGGCGSFGSERRHAGLS